MLDALLIEKNIKFSLVNAVKNLLQVTEELDRDMADFEPIIIDDKIIHIFPQPRTYERFADENIFGITPYWIARIILVRHFGIAFTSTNIARDDDSVPIWREISHTVNFFLDLKTPVNKAKHQVRFDEC